MRRPVVLITGASGEIGRGLIERLTTGDERRDIVTLDVNPLDRSLRPYVWREVTGSILDRSVLERLLAEYEIALVIHLAALLSTRAEFSPAAAHQVNVGGTLALLELAEEASLSHGRPVPFIYPSSIAAYGLPTLDAKQRAGPVREHEWAEPRTMYGCNKLYCEHLGRYFARHYRQLSAESFAGRVDFRALRFPGLISAVTIPSGGTSDYAPEMIHAAAQGREYTCFVRPDTALPFMTMPDAVEALLALAAAPRERLSKLVYNVRAFSATAEALQLEVQRAFPRASVSYVVDKKRQAIVDSWPADVDDAAARSDWGFAPAYDLRSMFDQYLLPALERSSQDS